MAPLPPDDHADDINNIILEYILITTGFPSFAKSPKLSAKRISLSADHLPRAALGKERSAKGLPAKVYLPRAPLGKLFAESKIKTLSKT